MSYQTMMMPGMMQPQQMVVMTSSSTQDKINRELFVGNTPPGTSEVLILHFMNAAMRRVGLCEPYETPIVDSRVNNKFAFIELKTAELANKALSLNGIPFLGSFLKVSRPSKYTGYNVPACTWQQLTGQSLPDGAALDAEQEKLSRELFIGNTTPEMTEGMIREFLGNAMQQVGLAILPGNPILACRVSGKFAFVELRSSQEARNALHLNNIPYMGAALRVGRPSKWNGPPDPPGNWEDILAKYMAGELQQAVKEQQQYQPPSQQQQINTMLSTTTTSSLPTMSTLSNQSLQQPERAPSRVVELQNMLTLQDLNNDEEYQEIIEDTREECSQFGTLLSVIVPKSTEPGATKIFLEYGSEQDAAKAIQGLEGRTFDERRVQANYFDEIKFAKKEYA